MAPTLPPSDEAPTRVRLNSNGSCNPQESDASTYPETYRVRVFTLNTLCSPVPNNKEEPERLQALADHIAEEKYDIVCLQEFMDHTCPLGVFDGEHQVAYHEFRAAMAKRGYQHQLLGPTLGPQAVFDGGTAIFSRHPFIATELSPWVDQVAWDAWAAKGIVYAEIALMPLVGCPWIQATRLHVITLHAQARHVGWMDLDGQDTYQRVRLQQMEQVASFINTRTSGGEAVLVLGDFNFDALQAKELELHQAVLRNGTTRDGPIDVIFASHGKYPVTFGALSEGEPVETFLTLPENLYAERCLDHVYLWPARRPEEAVELVSCDLQRLWVSPDPTGQRNFTQISDHYGWSVDLDVRWQACDALPEEPDSPLTQAVTLPPSFPCFAQAAWKEDAANEELEEMDLSLMMLTGYAGCRQGGPGVSGENMCVM